MSTILDELLHIFLIGGRTYTFKGVAILVDNETVLIFTYTAMSDGRTKKATFYKDKIAGTSRLIFGVDA